MILFSLILLVVSLVTFIQCVSKEELPALAQLLLATSIAGIMVGGSTFLLGLIVFFVRGV